MVQHVKEIRVKAQPELLIQRNGLEQGGVQSPLADGGKILLPQWGKAGRGGAWRRAILERNERRVGTVKAVQRIGRAAPAQVIGRVRKQRRHGGFVVGWNTHVAVRLSRLRIDAVDPVS